MAAPGVRTFRTSWDRYRRLPLGERRLVHRAIGHLSVVAVQRRLRGGVRQARNGVDRLRTADDVGQYPSPQRSAQLIARVAQGVPWQVTCLDRSLALARVLRRSGASPQLCLGVRRDDGELIFHAWLELDGLVVNDDVETIAAYSRFTGALPPSAHLR